MNYFGKNKTMSSGQKQILGLIDVAKKDNANGKFLANGTSWTPGQPNKVIDRKSHQGTISKQVNQEDRTVRTTDSIVMYMPPQVTQNTSALYKETELGGEIMESAGRVMSIISRAEALGGGTGGWGNAAIEALPGIAGQVKSAMFRGAAKSCFYIDGWRCFSCI